MTTASASIGISKVLINTLGMNGDTSSPSSLSSELVSLPIINSRHKNLVETRSFPLEPHPKLISAASYQKLPRYLYRADSDKGEEENTASVRRVSSRRNLHSHIERTWNKSRIVEPIFLEIRGFFLAIFYPPPPLPLVRSREILLDPLPHALILRHKDNF